MKLATLAAMNLLVILVISAGSVWAKEKLVPVSSATFSDETIYHEADVFVDTLNYEI